MTLESTTEEPESVQVGRVSGAGAVAEPDQPGE